VSLPIIVLRIELHEQPPDLVLREHDGEPLRLLRVAYVAEPRQVDAEHLLVEKQKRGERLLMGRRGDVALGDEVGEECLDLDCAERQRMTLAVIDDEPSRPIHVRTFSAHAVVLVADAIAYAIE
jgi:hypothetical protein